MLPRLLIVFLIGSIAEWNANPMRILYCNKYNFPFSGTEVHLFELMDLMRSGGHEVALFSMSDPRGPRTEYDQHFLPRVDFKQGKRGLISNARLTAHAIYSREARRRLRGMITEFRPDVAHVRNIYHHLSPSILWELKKHGVLPHFQKLPEKAPPPNADAAILYFGRLSAEKGVADLVQAMECAQHVSLVIAGDGPERPALQSLAQELKLTNVEFVGHQNGNDLDKLISASRFTVLPSRAYETLGKTILESYAWGRPVIASDLGSRRELVQEGETGLLFRLGDDVAVYCRNYFTPAIVRHNNMRLVRLPTIRSKHLETVIHTFLSTLHVCFSRCDVVHYHCLGPALFSFLPRLFGKKTVVTVQGLDWKRKKWGRIASAVLRWGEKASARFPDASVVVSQELRQHYRLTHGVETAYIPNGAMLRTRTAGVCLQKWGLEPDKYILFMGRCSPEKNCHLLIEAFKRIETDVKLVLAGGSSHSDDYMAALHCHESDTIRIVDWGDAEG